MRLRGRVSLIEISDFMDMMGLVRVVGLLVLDGLVRVAIFSNSERSIEFANLVDLRLFDLVKRLRLESFVKVADLFRLGGIAEFVRLLRLVEFSKLVCFLGLVGLFESSNGLESLGFLEVSVVGLLKLCGEVMIFGFLELSGLVGLGVMKWLARLVESMGLLGLDISKGFRSSMRIVEFFDFVDLIRLRNLIRFLELLEVIDLLRMISLERLVGLNNFRDHSRLISLVFLDLELFVLFFFRVSEGRQRIRR